MSYPQILRGENYLWWRSVLGVFFGISIFLTLLLLVPALVITVGYIVVTPGLTRVDYFAQAMRYERPIGLLASNLAIATLIPVSVALMAVIHGVSPRWLISIRARVRGRYLAAVFAVALVTLVGTYVLSILQVPPPLGLQKDFWWFLGVIIITSPIQALAEEVFFRGYLMQALGSLFARPWFGVIVSSVIFALFHGIGQNAALFVDRLAFGLLAAGLVYLTGGIEAGVAAHVINNVFAFGIAGVTSSIAALKAVQSLSWAQAGFDVGGFALFAVLAYLVSRLMRLGRRVNLVATRASA